MSPSPRHIRTNTLVLNAYWRSGDRERRAVTTYIYLLATLQGGTLHPPTPATLAKVGWTKPTYYRRVKGLIDAGLGRRDTWGNIRLKGTHEFIQQAREITAERKGAKRKEVKHKETIIFPHAPSEKEVRAAILNKFLERRIKQLSYTPRSRRAKISHELRRKAWLITPEQARLRTKGYTSVATKVAVRCMGISRSAFYRHRKTASGIKWETIREDLGLCGIAPGTAGLRGVYIDRRGHAIRQYPSMYRMTTKYNLAPAPKHTLPKTGLPLSTGHK